MHLHTQEHNNAVRTSVRVRLSACPNQVRACMATCSGRRCSGRHPRSLLCMLHIVCRKRRTSLVALPYCSIVPNTSASSLGVRLCTPATPCAVAWLGKRSSERRRRRASAKPRKAAEEKMPLTRCLVPVRRIITCVDRIMSYPLLSFVVSLAPAAISAATVVAWSFSGWVGLLVTA